MPDASGKFKGIVIPTIPWREEGSSMSEIKPRQIDDPASARVERARSREAAGWSSGLVSALNILEYGCDEGDYDDEVAAVTQLAEVAMEIHRAAREVIEMWDRGLYLPSLDTKPVMERLVEVSMTDLPGLATNQPRTER